jgi:serine/threonine protein kinase
MGASEPEPEIPDVVIDAENGKIYKKGNYLGKGGFAWCYEMTDSQTNVIYAAKVLPLHSRKKISGEVDIHGDLNHQNVVKCYGSFEFGIFVYVILDLCKGSLKQMRKAIPRLDEHLAGFYTYHILRALRYIHGKRVIHGDVKPQNVLLGDVVFAPHGREVKLGDFGWATRVVADGRTGVIGGTPNYAAPEMLLKTGYGFEVFLVL